MDFIEGVAIGVDSLREMPPSQELLGRVPSDPRAAHCRTVEEYRLFRYSSGYQDCEGGNNDLMENTSVDIIDGVE